MPRGRPFGRNIYEVVGEVAFVDVSTKRHPNLITAIDAADVPLVLHGGGRWYGAESDDGRISICRGCHPNSQLLAHLLCPVPNDMMVDHIDGNPLNNRRHNLRKATGSQNAANRRAVGKYGYKGVDKPPRGSYRVDITVNGKRRRFGAFATAQQAAAAYDEAALAAWGEYACTNASMGLL